MKKLTFHGYRKTGCKSLDVFDPGGYTRGHPAVVKGDLGLAAIYNNGYFLFADLIYFRFPFDGYHSRSYCHSGLTFLSSSTFRTESALGEVHLQHNGFTGDLGKRYCQFALRGRLGKIWDVSLGPHEMLHLIPFFGGRVESLWVRPVCMRKELTNLQ